MPPFLSTRLRRACTTWLLAPLLAFAGDFAHETSDLPVDPDVTWGRLPNGLRYALRHNAEPRGRISARLALRVGSVNENENQRGLAHFLEHLAFNGSRHFPSADVVEFFQRLGLEFGGDTNASTGFDRTLYQLELPDTKPGTLRESLTFFADVAGGLLLEAREIDKERGIILSEKRARDSVDLRTFQAELDFLVPDTRFPQRLPIGTEEVIRTADRERFIEFYHAWYRPERMLLVLVGDLNPAAVEPLVQELFTPLTARAPALPEPRLGTVTPPEDVVARLKPLAAPGNPWFGSAGEMVGIAYLKMGKNDLAGAMFAAVAKDKDVPESIRARVVQLAGNSGVDVDPVKGVNVK